MRAIGVTLLAQLTLWAFAGPADPAEAFVYWANSTSGSLGRANLDGTGADQRFVTGANSPRGVAVDAGHVYWANSMTDTIGRADVDGSHKNQNFISTASYPASVAVGGGHVYWANLDTGTIGRANLNGSHKNQNFITGVSGNGVAVGAR